MRIMWLGQAGFLFTTCCNTNIMVDPYLSNSMEKKCGHSFKRLVPLEKKILDTPVDVLVLTHIHGDHTDYQTLDAILKRKAITVIAPPNVAESILSRYGYGHNVIFATPGVEVSFRDVLFHVNFSAHSTTAIGVTIKADGNTLVHTGDTLYHTRLLDELPRGADILFLPINGVGNNMNCHDAFRLTMALMPKKVFPMHWDMFKDYSCDPNGFCKLFPETGEISPICSPPYEYFDL